MREAANVRAGEWASGRVGEWANGRMGEWANGRMGEWANGRMGEWANGRSEARSAGEILVRRLPGGCRVSPRALGMDPKKRPALKAR
jgi:hypothetical protein